MKFGSYEIANFTEKERDFLARNHKVQGIIRDDLEMKLSWVRWHWEFQVYAWMEDDKLLVPEWAYMPRQVFQKDLVLAQSFFAE
jgi:alkyl hydroperoxide reductase subunit AhpC